MRPVDLPDLGHDLVREGHHRRVHAQQLRPVVLRDPEDAGPRLRQVLPPELSSISASSWCSRPADVTLIDVTDAGYWMK